MPTGSRPSSRNGGGAFCLFIFFPLDVRRYRVFLPFRSSRFWRQPYPVQPRVRLAAGPAPRVRQRRQRHVLRHGRQHRGRVLLVRIRRRRARRRGRRRRRPGGRVLLSLRPFLGPGPGRRRRSLGRRGLFHRAAGGGGLLGGRSCGRLGGRYGGRFDGRSCGRIGGRSGGRRRRGVAVVTAAGRLLLRHHHFVQPPAQPVPVRR